MTEKVDIIIVGGGVIGVNLAYCLAQREAGQILLLERDTLGSGSTGRSVASIDWLTLHPPAVELFAHSAAFFAHCDELLGAPCGYERTGSIALAGPQQEVALRTAVPLLQKAGMDVRLLTLAEVSQLEPALNLDGVSAASYAPQAGYMDPAMTTQALAAAARRLGVDIRQGSDVTGVQLQNGRVAGVRTTAGPIGAALAVVAAGAWSIDLLPAADGHLPLQPVQHPVVCIRRPPHFGPTHPSLLDLTSGLYARPESGGLTLAGSIDPQVGYDPITLDEGHGYVHDEYLMWCMERLIQRYPELEASELRAGWSGIMSITPDWQPIIGAWPGYEGLFTATGFSGRGFQVCPGTADFLAGLIMGDPLAAKRLAPFSPLRFTGDKLSTCDRREAISSLLG